MIISDLYLFMSFFVVHILWERFDLYGIHFTWEQHHVCQSLYNRRKLYFKSKTIDNNVLFRLTTNETY